MLLALDVGNTNITIGLFDADGKIYTSFRITTKIQRTSDEFGILLCELIKSKGAKLSEIEDTIIASVVPGIMYSLTSAIVKYFGKQPIIIGAGIKTGIKVVSTNPKEIGADRIVDAAAARELYGGPVIVIDFGTATTYDLILEDATFAAGVTAAGIQSSANALFDNTARLPEVEIKSTASILAKDTITSIQAGIVYGFVGQTEYIVRKIKEESGIDGIKVVATGGIGKIIAQSANCIDVYDPMLTMKGLWLIYKKYKNI